MPFFSYMTAALPANNTLTRASTGWFINSSGTYTSSANDTARFTYDPVSLALQGLLVEPSRTNSGPQSNTMSVSPWAASNATLTASAIASPDGGTNGVRLTENSVNNAHVDFNAIAPAGSPFALSCYFHVGSGGSTRFANMQQAGGGAGGAYYTAIYDLSAISVTQTGVLGGGGILSSSISDAGGSWRRLTLTGMCPLVGSQNFFQVALSNVSSGATFDAFGGVDYTGDSTSNLCVWGGQAEAGPNVTSLITTTTVPVTRAQDILTINSTGVPNGVYNITITRLSGVSYIPAFTVSGGYTVPTDPSPLQSIMFTGFSPPCGQAVL